MLLFKTKKTKLNIDNIDVIIHLEKGTAYKEQLELIGLTELDLKYLKGYESLIIPHIPKMVDDFYSAITDQNDLEDIINTHSSVQKLKGTLKKHLSEMFSGMINNTFIEKRKKIASMHVKIGLESKWYLASFTALFDSFNKIVTELDIDEEDKYNLTSAWYKMLNLEQQLVQESYDDQVVTTLQETMIKASRASKEKIISEYDDIIRKDLKDSKDSIRSIKQMSNKIVNLVESNIFSLYIFSFKFHIWKIQKGRVRISLQLH